MHFTDVKWSGAILTVAMLLSGAANSSCDFDTDDADGPDFLDKIIECEKQQSSRDNSEGGSKASSSVEVTKLYGEGSLTASGIVERPVAAPGTLSHYAKKSFVARQPYSLRPDAKFEESVTIAIQKLHLKCMKLMSLALTATVSGVSAVRSAVCAPPGSQPRFRGLFKSRRASSSAVSRAFRSLRFARNSAASSSATSRALRSLRFAHKAASSLLALALALGPDSRMIRRTDFRAKSVSGTSAFSRAMVH